MWILPKNYPLSSRFALDMVESKEDLTLQALNIESSLMWRSKPSPLLTWLARWKADSYLPHLFTRILKPSQRISFETALTSSLVDIHVNLSQPQVSDSEKMTPDTSGPTSGDILNQLNLLESSLKMSKATSRLDSTASSAIWKKMITEQRGEYSQRVKLAHHTREKESTSWATPNTMDYLPQRSEEALVRQATTQRKGRTRPANLREQVNPKAVEIYKNNLTAVETAEKFPTPSARDWKDSPGMAKTAINPDGSERKRNDQLARAVYATENPISGHLNPDWVEWLMGVPTGWTGLGSWETE